MNPVGLVILLVAFLLGVRVRSDLLPSLAIISYVIFPVKLTYALGMYWLFPSLVFLAIWAFRRGVRTLGRESTGYGSWTGRLLVLIPAVGLIYWLIFVFIWGSGGSTQSAWAISFAIGVVLPVFVRATDSDVGGILACWSISSALVGLFCVIESYLQFVPLYGWLYSVYGIPSLQHWSTYRAEGSFGHPLYAATFLGVGVVLSLALWMRKRGLGQLVYLVSSAAGLMATVSRGALVGLAFGILTILVISVTVKSARRKGNFVAWMVFTILLGATILSGSLVERLNSEEAAGSDRVREQIYEVASIAAANDHWLGSGMGTSSETIAPLNPVGYPLESSFWQLVVSIGVPGVAILGLLLLVAFVTAVRAGDSESAAGLLAFVLSISTYNAIDQLRPQQILLGLLIVACIRSRRRNVVAPSRSTFGNASAVPDRKA